LTGLDLKKGAFALTKNWIYRNTEEPPAELAGWAKELDISETIATLLWKRGYDAPAAMDAYLSPGLKNLMQPRELPGLEEGARVLAQELTAGKTLAVWGDYDVDGVTGSALVLDYLRGRGFNPLYHIPNRMEEGYGLNMAGIERLAGEGADILLTVDCGVSNVAEVARARELGMTVVVSDHHLPGETLPEAHAVCDPKLSDNAGADLAGVGVAFFLMAALGRLLPGEPSDIRRLLDLTALGTLADVVPLRGQNRILAKNGMLLISEASRPGVYALKEACGHNPKAALGAGQIVFGLAPRINAAGRMGQADKALALLLARDLDEARPLAAFLDQENARRRKEEDDIREEALAQAEEQSGRMGLALYEPHWHTGIIGIVASRIVDRHYRPTLIAALENGRIKGSGRSIPEFDLHGALTNISDILLSFGGHRQAAGFSLAPENFEALRERFHKEVVAQLGETPLTPRLSLDGELDFSRIDPTLLREIELMQPFGCGNPEPVFASPPVNVTDHRVFGADHVNLGLRDASCGLSLRGKAWRMAGLITKDVSGQTARVAFTPRFNTYNGLTSIELGVKDFHFFSKS